MILFQNLNTSLWGHWATSHYSNRDVWGSDINIEHNNKSGSTKQTASNEYDIPGSKLLECPITGGLEALKKGQMAVWVGGDKEAYLEVKPILSASYSSVMYTGGLGTAMIPKVLSNMLCGLQVCAMAEAMLIGS